MNTARIGAELARFWRGEGRIAPIHPGTFGSRGVELAQEHSTIAELAHELARNWRTPQPAFESSMNPPTPSPNRPIHDITVTIAGEDRVRVAEMLTGRTWSLIFSGSPGSLEQAERINALCALIIPFDDEPHLDALAKEIAP